MFGNSPISSITAAAVDRAPIDAGLLVDGRWSAAGARLEVRNPADPDEIVGSVIRATEADVDRAVAAAHAAQRAWAAIGWQGRADILRLCLDALDSDIEDRVPLFVRENGKTLEEARIDLMGVSARQRLTLDLVDVFKEERRLSGPTGRTAVDARPYGVVVAIVPWNGPVGLAFLDMVPALLAGNTVVVKPPETCPLTLIRSIDLIADLLPPGVVNVITGLPSEIGQRITSHPDVRKIAFTGSTESARAIIANAAGTIKSLSLELGGNDAAILLDDVDLGAETMARMVRATYRMAGQVCMAVKRVYVPSRLLPDFVEAFAAAADSYLSVGNGLDPGVTMGPLHTERALDRARVLVDDAAASGATVRTLGTADEVATGKGWFLRPMIVTDVPDDAPLVATEQFSPVLPVLPYDHIDDAVRRANDTEYGLGGSVWGADVERALSVASRVEAGTLWVNAHGTWAIDRRAPYGGIKQSGIGRRAGREGLEEYLQTVTVTTYEPE